MRNLTRLWARSMFSRGVEMLFEAGSWRSLHLFAALSGTYVPHHRYAHANQRNKADHRDDEENQHLQKDIKAQSFPCVNRCDGLPYDGSQPALLYHI